MAASVLVNACLACAAEQIGYHGRSMRLITYSPRFGCSHIVFACLGSFSGSRNGLGSTSSTTEPLMLASRVDAVQSDFAISFLFILAPQGIWALPR